MDISIIIPVYNGEETLIECLDAVNILNYDCHSYEIVIVNDGSTDNSLCIAEKYQAINSNIRIVSLPQNSGRIIARETGAKNARFDNLLFVDSRIIVSADILEQINKINYQPLMAGDLGEDKYRSNLDTLFYLIRRKVYKPYYPQTEYQNELWINKDNFLKAPKGTGCFFVNRELFLTSSPDTKSKHTSDDTLLMENIVFKAGIKILKHTAVKAIYRQRVCTNVYGWIYKRGGLWADYYLSFYNKYAVLYMVVNLIILFALIYPMVFSSNTIIFILSLIIGGFTAVAAYLAENAKDFFIVLKTFPVISVVFYWGTIRGLIYKLMQSLSAVS